MCFRSKDIKLYLVQRLLNELNHLRFAVETIAMFDQHFRRSLGDEFGIAKFLLCAIDFFLKQLDLFEDVFFGFLQIRILHGCSHFDRAARQHQKAARVTDFESPCYLEAINVLHVLNQFFMFCKAEAISLVFP